MANSQLDSLDYKILQMLSVNARKPYLEIARECNVSGAAIHQRIQKLINTGVLIGSESLVNPSASVMKPARMWDFSLRTLRISTRSQLD